MHLVEVTSGSYNIAYHNVNVAYTIYYTFHFTNMYHHKTHKLLAFKPNYKSYINNKHKFKHEDRECFKAHYPRSLFDRRFAKHKLIIPFTERDCSYSSHLSL